VGVCVWGGDTRPIVTQKYTFHLEALTDRFAPMRPRRSCRVRARRRSVLDMSRRRYRGTRGTSVVASSRARSDDAMRRTRRATTEIISSPHASRDTARKRANARTERISRSTPIRLAIRDNRAWSMGWKKSFLWEISRGRFECVIHGC